MVLALPRSVPRCLGSLASRRLFHQAAAASRPVFHGRRPIPTSTAPPYRGVLSGRLRGGLPGPGTSIRMLTGAREKVKVLLVLYDGGQHAKDVSFCPSRESRFPLVRPSEKPWTPSAVSPTSPPQTGREIYRRGGALCGVAARPRRRGSSPASWPAGVICSPVPGRQMRPGRRTLRRGVVRPTSRR